MLIHYLESILGGSWLEQIASVIALAGIVMTVKSLSFSWILDILSSALYMCVFYTSGFYSDSLLQIVFIGMSAYGLFSWTSKRNGKPVFFIRSITVQELLVSSFLVPALTLAGGYIFSHYIKGAAYPYLDSFCTAVSIVATWLTARKVLENWYLWIFADLIYICLFFKKQLYPTAILYTVLVLLAIIGLSSWKKLEKTPV